MTQEQTTLIINTVPNKVARECILKKGLYHKKGVPFKKKSSMQSLLSSAILVPICVTFIIFQG